MSSHPYHPTIRRGLFATIAVLLTLALGFGSTALASSATYHHPPAAPKPTIVLVHGAWADASGWNQVSENLQRRGYTVLAPANPLRSLASDSSYLASILATIAGPVVLVGHSYGGAVITNAALGNPNVKALVYIAAFAPDQGESLGGIEAMNPGSEIGPSTLTFRPYTVSGGGGVDAYINASAFHDACSLTISPLPPRRSWPRHSDRSMPRS